MSPVTHEEGRVHRVKNANNSISAIGFVFALHRFAASSAALEALARRNQ